MSEPCPRTRAVEAALRQATHGRRGAVESGSPKRLTDNLIVFDVLLDRYLELRPELAMADSGPATP